MRDGPPSWIVRSRGDAVGTCKRVAQFADVDSILAEGGSAGDAQQTEGFVELLCAGRRSQIFRGLVDLIQYIDQRPGVAAHIHEADAKDFLQFLGFRAAEC